MLPPEVLLWPSCPPLVRQTLQISVTGTWEEQWRDLAMAAKIDDSYDIKLVGRWINQDEAASASGLRHSLSLTLSPKRASRWIELKSSRSRRRLRTPIKVTCTSSAGMSM